MDIINKYGHPINFWNSNPEIQKSNFDKLALTKQDNRGQVYIENHFYNQEPMFIAKVFQAIKELFIRPQGEDNEDDGLTDL